MSRKLAHPNHSKQFYEMLTLFMPDWKSWKKIPDEKNAFEAFRLKE